MLIYYISLLQSNFTIGCFADVSFCFIKTIIPLFLKIDFYQLEPTILFVFLVFRMVIP